MAGRNLLRQVMGLFGVGAEPPPPPVERRRPVMPVSSFVPPPPRNADPDAMNPATITHVGRVPDGRELVRTLGLGSYLVDREVPTICYFIQGNVAEIPTVELRHLFGCLMEKRQFGDHATSYVDLLNVASYELQARSGRLKRQSVGPRPGAAQPLPRQQMVRAAHAPWPDMENPATITRVGRSAGGAELVMTLGLGTFVVYREPPALRYFDRGREWEVPLGEIQVLIEALLAKQDTAEHQASYVDLLNVATAVRQSPPQPRPRRR
ncbi:MAG: hypothetical protein VKS61_16605 [Candidatus Sericytochromatia bacterium]|nr:hypothetical protein [Candidatus Sericytochromatia bacterium]